MRKLTAIRLVAGLIVVGIVLAVGFYVANRMTELPAANADFTISIAPGVSPLAMPSRVAAIARHYLDEQTPELAAPGIHDAPIISRVAAVLARDARQAEAGIPEDQAAVQPTRIVWVVWAAGDFLNLHDLPWSHAGVPYTQGRIVIDDATQTILGVYPHEPGN